MIQRLTVSVPDAIAEAVRATAGDDVSAWVQRAIRERLVAHDLALLEAHDVTTGEDAAAAMEADIDQEHERQARAKRRVP